MTGRMQGIRVLRNFEDLVGETLTGIFNDMDTRLIFFLENGEAYKLYHYQNCCESVLIADINGELGDVIGLPIVLAEEIHNAPDPPDWNGPSWYESYTWTFYRLATNRGWVVIRWYGASNGYYSEEVDWGVF